MKSCLHLKSWSAAVLGTALACFGLSLVACGDDDSSSGTDENVKKGVAEYETTDDMVHCTKSHYG